MTCLEPDFGIEANRGPSVSHKLLQRRLLHIPRLQVGAVIRNRPSPMLTACRRDVNGWRGSMAFKLALGRWLCVCMHSYRGEYVL